MSSLIRIQAGSNKEAESIAKLIINRANEENRIIAVSKTRKVLGKYEKKVALGEIREVSENIKN
jgi:hypothetical protein